jgi:hypothetical protein
MRENPGRAQLAGLARRAVLFKAMAGVGSPQQTGADAVAIPFSDRTRTWLHPESVGVDFRSLSGGGEETN